MCVFEHLDRPLVQWRLDELIVIVEDVCLVDNSKQLGQIVNKNKRCIQCRLEFLQLYMLKRLCVYYCPFVPQIVNLLVLHFSDLSTCPGNLLSNFFDKLSLNIWHHCRRFSQLGQFRTNPHVHSTAVFLLPVFLLRQVVVQVVVRFVK